MREVDTKVLYFSVYFTYVSVSEPMYAQEISASRFVELCLVVLFSEIVILLHTHTSYFLKTSLATLFFTPLTVHTRYFSCVAVMNRVLTNLCWVLSLLFQLHYLFIYLFIYFSSIQPHMWHWTFHYNTSIQHLLCSIQFKIIRDEL